MSKQMADGKLILRPKKSLCQYFKVLKIQDFVFKSGVFYSLSDALSITNHLTVNEEF